MIDTRRQVHLLIAVLGTLLGAACTTAPVPPGARPPVEDRGAPVETPGGAQTRPLPDGGAVQAYPEPAFEPPEARPLPEPELAPVPPAGGSAVVALLDRADRQARGGDLGAAAASLERALRIEPRNALLWHRLARVRLAQGDARQAEQLAAKSNSLAGGDPALKAANWKLIARARRTAGHTQGAAEAEARARE